MLKYNSCCVFVLLMLVQLLWHRITVWVFYRLRKHLFNSHYMFRPQRVIFRCYKHMVLKLYHKSHTFSSLASNCWSTYIHFLHSVGLIVKCFYVYLYVYLVIHTQQDANNSKNYCDILVSASAKDDLALIPGPRICCIHLLLWVK
jgi:hypothetical protein